MKRLRIYADYTYWCLPFKLFVKHGIIGFGFLCWHAHYDTSRVRRWM